MIDAFISYRRKPSAPVAQLLQEKLKNRHNLEVYVDTNYVDSSQVQFSERLMKAIADARYFICLLADDTLQSEWVQREIEQAYSLRKPCIPIFQESFVPPSTVSAAVQYLLDYDGLHIFDIKNIYIDETVDKLALRLRPQLHRRNWRMIATVAVLSMLLLLLSYIALLRRVDVLDIPTAMIGITPVDNIPTNTAPAALVTDDNFLAWVAAARETATSAPTMTPTLSPALFALYRAGSDIEYRSVAPEGASIDTARGMFPDSSWEFRSDGSFVFTPTGLGTIVRDDLFPLHGTYTEDEGIIVLQAERQNSSDVANNSVSLNGTLDFRTEAITADVVYFFQSTTIAVVNDQTFENTNYRRVRMIIPMMSD